MKRPNGQGSVFFDKSKNRYTAAFITPEGRRISKRFKTQEEAENWLEDNRYNIRHNSFVAPTALKTGVWLAQYLTVYKQSIRPQSLKTYLMYAKNCQPIANIPLQKLTSIDIQSLINKWNKNKYSSSFVNSHLVFLASALKKAAALDLIQKNPMLTVERPKSKSRKVEIFTLEETKKLLEYTDRSRYRRLHVIITIALYTGMRISEILALEWTDITPSTIRVSKTVIGRGNSAYIQNAPKTSTSNRKVSIPGDLYNVIMEWKENTHATSGPLFKTRFGNAVSYDIIGDAFKTVQKALGFENVRSFHSLRHTHASYLIANGVSVAEVAKRLGHSNPSITLNTYTSWIPGNDEKVAQDVSEIFNPSRMKSQ